MPVCLLNLLEGAEQRQRGAPGAWRLTSFRLRVTHQDSLRLFLITALDYEGKAVIHALRVNQINCWTDEAHRCARCSSVLCVCVCVSDEMG